MRDHFPIQSVFALALFLIAGCAVTPTIEQVRPIKVDLSLYRSIQVVVDARENIRRYRGYNFAATELRKAFIADVLASGKYASVGTEAQTGKSLEVSLTITDFFYVSDSIDEWTRKYFGTGQAILEVTMTLKDNETGAVIGAIAAGHTDRVSKGQSSVPTSIQIAAIAKALSSRVTNR